MVVVVSLILSQAQKCRATRPEQTGGCRGGREREALRPEAAAAWPRGLQGPRSACFAATANREDSAAPHGKGPRVHLWRPEAESFEDAAPLTLVTEGAPLAAGQGRERGPEPRGTRPLTPRLQGF